MRRIGVAVLLGVMAQAAGAANWVFLGQDSQGALSIDADSIVRQGRIVHYWLRQDLPDPQPFDPATHKRYQRMEVLRYVNCAAQSSAIQAERLLAPDGSLVSAAVQPDPPGLQYQPVRPHTYGESEMRFVCHTARHA